MNSRSRSGVSVTDGRTPASLHNASTESQSSGWPSRMRRSLMVAESSPSAIGEYQPEVYEANSPAGETEGSSLVAARLLRTLDANGGHSRRSPSRPHGEWPTSRMRQNPLRDGGSNCSQFR